MDTTISGTYVQILGKSLEQMCTSAFIDDSRPIRSLIQLGVILKLAIHFYVTSRLFWAMIQFEKKRMHI